MDILNYNSDNISFSLLYSFLNHKDIEIISFIIITIRIFDLHYYAGQAAANPRPH